MHSKEMCRETKIHTCLPLTLVPFSTPAMVILCTEVPKWQLRILRCLGLMANRYFNETSTNQSSMAKSLHRFQHDGICASLPCIVSTLPLPESPQRDTAGGVGGSSLPLLWTHSASTAGAAPCDQDGFTTSLLLLSRLCSCSHCTSPSLG